MFPYGGGGYKLFVCNQCFDVVLQLGGGGVWIRALRKNVDVGGIEEHVCVCMCWDWYVMHEKVEKGR